MTVEYEEVNDGDKRLVEVKQNGKAWVFQVLGEDHLGAHLEGGSFSKEEVGSIPEEVREKLEEKGWSEIDL